MASFLHFLRLNLALFILGSAFLWANLSEGPGASRGIASEDLGCADAMAALIRDGLEYEPRGQALQDGIANYDDKLAEIEEMIFTPKSFSRQYFNESNQNPTLKEIVEKLILGHQRLVAEIYQLRTASPSVKYFVDETVKSLNFTDKEKANFQKFITENKALLNQRVNLVRPGTPEEKELARKIDSIWKNPYGDFGELTAALHFQGVEAQNLHLRLYKVQAVGPKVEFHQNKIVDATSQAIDALENATDETMARFKERFPRIFPDNRDDDLDAIKKWLETKEVDLITRAQQGRYYFIEVKNYNRPVDKETLEGGFKGSKSVLEQQLEMKEILEFLELDALYSPAITFLKGVTPEARQVLEEVGIMVIDYP